MADLNSKVGLGVRGKSTTSRWAEESRKQARDSGELPHEFLLRVSRGDVITIKEFDGDEIKEKTYYPSFQDRIDAAQLCANYFAPKLSAQQTESLDPVSEMTDEELNRQLAELSGGQ